MKTRHTLIIAALMAVAMFSGCKPRGGGSPTQPTGQAHRYTVAVFLMADHPVINQLHRGFVDALAQKAWAAGKVDYVVRNAGGDAGAIQAIATELADGQYAAIYVVGVPAAQALLKRQPKSPVICGGPPDPVAAGLAESLQRPGKGCTGTTMFPPVSQQLDMLLTIYPKASRLSVLFSPAEANAVAVVGALVGAAKEKGIALTKVPVSTASELRAALAKAETSGDAFYVPTDNMLHSVMGEVARFALEAHKPLINCSEDSVKKGALFSLAADYYDVGRLSADLMDEVVVGRKDASLIPFREIPEPVLYLNTDTARRLGVAIPDAWRTKARLFPEQAPTPGR